MLTRPLERTAIKRWGGSRGGTKWKGLGGYCGECISGATWFWALGKKTSSLGNIGKVEMLGTEKGTRTEEKHMHGRTVWGIVEVLTRNNSNQLSICRFLKRMVE